MVPALFNTEVFLDPEEYSSVNFSNIRTAYIIPNTGLYRLVANENWGKI